MTLDLDAWHARYRQQAGWTAELRRFLFSQPELANARRWLDVGCGTGALESELQSNADGGQITLVGVDISKQNLDYAKYKVAHAAFIQADALSLPFPAACFDLVYCHFLLLWLSDPLRALKEMRRVTQPGGSVLALAEPDYDGRIDYPPELKTLGVWQRESLRRQGAHPDLGRRLGWLFHQAGFHLRLSGVLGAQWTGAPAAHELASEQAILRHDLEILFNSSPTAGWQVEYQKLTRLEEAAWRSGERVLYVPTFYAWGVVPE